MTAWTRRVFESEFTRIPRDVLLDDEQVVLRKQVIHGPQRACSVCVGGGFRRERGFLTYDIHTHAHIPTHTHTTTGGILDRNHTCVSVSVYPTSFIRYLVVSLFVWPQPLSSLLSLSMSVFLKSQKGPYLQSPIVTFWNTSTKRLEV